MKGLDELKDERVPIKNLNLWDENARFPDKYFNKAEDELIRYFLSKKDFKVMELAQAIIEDFKLPQSEKLIVYDDGGKLTVLEGNRRVTVYKLLANPSLISDNPELKSFFEEAKSKINITDDFSLECLVTSNKDTGYRYIDRKHAHGNHEVGWGDTERAHYNVRRGRAKKDELLKIAIARFIKDVDLPEMAKEQILGPGYVTTFYRIIMSGPASKEFGLDCTDKGELIYSDPDFKEKLKTIIWNVLSKEDFSGQKVDSRSLNKKEKIETYLKSVSKDDAEKVDSEVKKGTQTNLLGDKTVLIPQGGQKRANPKSISRVHLIPRTCVLQIEKNRINDIYLELRDDLLLDDSSSSVPNAVGALFRIFLEVSIDYFLEREGVILKPDTKLAGKITTIADTMEQKGIATQKQLYLIRKVAIAQNSILSIDNFHDYVHSFESLPASSDLKAKWDSLQEFFELLWGYLATKPKNKKP